MLSAIELKQTLSQYHGSECVYRHSINPQVVYTEGAQALAVGAGAYWLLDEIAIANLTRQVVRDEVQQIWKLVREDANGAKLICDGNDGRGGDARLFTKYIPWTDFPLPEQKLYCMHDGSRFCIMLPSEY